MRNAILLCALVLFSQCTKSFQGDSTIQVFTEFSFLPRLPQGIDRELLASDTDIDDIELMEYASEYIPEAYAFIQQERPEVIIGSSLGVTEEFRWSGTIADEFPQYLMVGKSEELLTAGIIVRSRTGITEWSDVVEKNILVVTPHFYETYSGLLIYLTLWTHTQKRFDSNKVLMWEFLSKLSNDNALYTSNMIDAEHTFFHTGIGDALLTFQSRVKAVISPEDESFSYIPFPEELNFPLYIQLRKDLVDNFDFAEVHALVDYLLKDEEVVVEDQQNITDSLGSWNLIVLTHIIAGGELSRIMSEDNSLFFSPSKRDGLIEELSSAE